MRLNRFIAQSGYASRREADKMIKEKRVEVNGIVIDDPSYEVKNGDKVKVDGVGIKLPDKFVYYVFYKPAGYITTRKDKYKRPTIYDIIKEKKYRLNPVGRLDMDTEGLLILTNDGDFINGLTHPSYEVPRVYVATIKGELKLSDKEKMLRGFRVKGKIYKADKIKVLSYNRDKNTTRVEITLHTGGYHEVKDMFFYRGYKVIHLKRIKYGVLSLGKMKAGEMRQLTKDEIEKMKSYYRR